MDMDGTDFARAMLMARALIKYREVDCEMKWPAGTRRWRKVIRLPGIKGLLTTSTKIT
jgi:hypothetical protein